VTRWQHDPFTRGSYTSILTGGTADDLDVLAAPVGGRVLFAGEATDHNRYAHADGAMRSGIREAKRILQRPSVDLSAG
jgi:monoamine oxidase